MVGDWVLPESVPDWEWSLKPRVFRRPGLRESAIVFRLVGRVGDHHLSAWQRITPTTEKDHG